MKEKSKAYPTPKVYSVRVGEGKNEYFKNLKSAAQSAGISLFVAQKIMGKARGETQYRANRYEFYPPLKETPISRMLDGKTYNGHKYENADPNQTKILIERHFVF